MTDTDQTKEMLALLDNMDQRLKLLGEITRKLQTMCEILENQILKNEARLNRLENHL